MRRRNLKCNRGISEITEQNSDRTCGFVQVLWPSNIFHAEKTTSLAATIVPVMILHGLHTDSTYQSPLREVFVKGHQGRFF